MPDRGFTNVNTYVFLKKDDQILLLLRKNTGYMDGYYGLVAGHVERGESAKEGMIREAFEEAGIHIKPHDLKPVHIMHRKTERTNLDIFFECTHWEGEIINSEPHKCESLDFFSLNHLPSNIMPYLKDALKAIHTGIIYSELGWVI